jgi:hypothetical protein
MENEYPNGSQWRKARDCKLKYNATDTNKYANIPAELEMDTLYTQEYSLK